MCEIMEKLTTEARDEGMTQGTLKTLFSLVQDGVITISEAAKRADMTEVIFKEKTQRFKS